MTKFNNQITFKAALILVAKEVYSRELRDTKAIVFDPDYYQKDGRPYCPICKADLNKLDPMCIRQSKKGYFWWSCSNFQKHKEKGFAKPKKYDYNGKPSERDWQVSDKDVKKYNLVF